MLTDAELFLLDPITEGKEASAETEHLMKVVSGLATKSKEKGTEEDKARGKDGGTACGTIPSSSFFGTSGGEICTLYDSGQLSKDGHQLCSPLQWAARANRALGSSSLRRRETNEGPTQDKGDTPHKGYGEANLQEVGEIFLALEAHDSYNGQRGFYIMVQIRGVGVA